VYTTLIACFLGARHDRTQRRGVDGSEDRAPGSSSEAWRELLGRFSGCESLDSQEVLARRVIETLLLLLLVPGFCGAKSSQGNWDNLEELRPGQKIEVVDSNMKTLNATFVSVSDEAISLQVGTSVESVLRAKVVRVSVHDNSHRMRNMLLGAGIAGGIALIPAGILLVQQGNEGNSCSACAAAIVAGFGGGAALGAIPGSRTIYRTKTQ